MIRGLLLIASVLIAMPAHAQSPVMKPALFNTIYVPGGFDDNDTVQIVGEGMFRNTCYRPATTGVKVDQETKTITLSPAAYEYSGLCLQVILPFERVLDVGLLKAGEYKVVQGDGSQMQDLGTFKVGVAKSFAPDDYLYAPISQAFFRQKAAVSEVMLTGDFPTDCMHLDQVKVTIEPKVIVLQPIAKIEERNNCLRGKFPFNKLVKIDLVPKGRYLLHVRSMNAKAVNTLIDVNY